MTDASDRRRSPRLGLPARAFVLARRGERLAFGLRDLSVRGARLVGHSRLQVYERVRVELEFETEAVVVGAEVVRIDPQNAQVAVEFRDVPPGAQALIERAIASLVVRARSAASAEVLVLQAPPEIAAALERDLAQLGRGARACATSQEVLTALGEPGARCEAVIIHGDAPDGPALLEALTAQHPRVQRILLFGEHLGSLDHASATRVHAVLRTPWRIRPLARALGVDSPDSSMVMMPAQAPEKPRR